MTICGNTRNSALLHCSKQNQGNSNMSISISNYHNWEGDCTEEYYDPVMESPQPIQLSSGLVLLFPLRIG